MHPPSKPVTFLVGAGASRDPPSSALLWSEILSVATKALMHDANEHQVASTIGLYEMLEYFMAKNPRPDALFSVLAEAGAFSACQLLVRDCLGTGIPNENHLMLAEVCNRLRPPPIILSANYDGYIERALADLNCQYKMIRNDFSQLSLRESPTLIKLHGSINTDEITMFLANVSRDYASRQGLRYTYIDVDEPEPLFNSISMCLPYNKYCAVESALKDCLLCVMGYSGADSDIMPLVSRSLAQGHASVQWVIHPGSETPKVVLELQSQYGARIKVVKSSISNFLRKFVSLEDREPKQTISVSVNNANPARFDATSPLFSLSDVIAISLEMAKFLGNMAVAELVDEVHAFSQALPHQATSYFFCNAADYCAARGLLEHARHYINLSKRVRSLEKQNGLRSILDRQSMQSLAFKQAQIESTISFIEQGKEAAFAVIRNAWKQELSMCAERLVPALVWESFMGFAADSAASCNELEDCLEFGSHLLRTVEQKAVSQLAPRSLVFHAGLVHKMGEKERALAILDMILRYSEDLNDVENQITTRAVIDRLRKR